MRPLGDTLVWMPPLTTLESEVNLLAAATRAAILRDLQTCLTVFHVEHHRQSTARRSDFAFNCSDMAPHIHR